ncbi:SRPBCC family protein [Actinokineospora globicatena]|uniref:MxaD family protein n=1 Tax=Actinokineospora globicatena TaxID=103729 RepID=A0A9W6QNR1_9PSEU|nr:SRPBCC family protein [Actinokineospora globicatena]MCP2301056.1 Polyketide cyclase / dehydrase and lipid transport [Actinokineospora globicatena]GLW77310.1 MxaD family protein [Actinokineospora globicatena]GLW84144.1 MxaD family protein [Actinokineospora globicatena]GLW91912.1 MxaD family protein [Actinokineospora globicatena]
MVERQRTFAFEITTSSSADAATLFTLVSDGRRWSEWARPVVAESYLEREGDPSPGGVGAIRVLGRKPVLVREETVEYEQDRRHVYVLRSASPVKDYRGEVTFIPRDGGGTDLVWRISFVERIPGTGTVVRAGLRSFIQDLAKRLVQAAER